MQHRIVERLKLIVLITTVAVCLGFALMNAHSAAKTTNENQSTAQNQAAQTNQTSPAQTTAKPADAAPLEGCISCHGKTEPMHPRFASDGKEDLTLDAQGKDGQGMSCTSCHGGNPIALTIDEAHVRPRFPERWTRTKNGELSSRNPENTGTILNGETYEFVRFVNPGDVRVSSRTCGACHSVETEHVASNMMLHGGMLWGAALYNNGGFPIKDTRFGESYAEETGAPQELIRNPAPTPAETKFKGILAFLSPLPRWEISQPGNVLRVFERGGRRRLEVALPDREEEGGKPDKGLSPRGLGTNNRTDPVYLGLQKTRLLDPTLNSIGTNDHAGDYRSAGCTACHVVYANDRSVIHAAQYAMAGNSGATETNDESMKRARDEAEPGHPIRHQFTNKIPSSQCMTCHMHPGTNMVASYYGVTWWDNETHGDKMYPKEQQDLSSKEEQEKLNRNPEAASLRGKWSDSEFLKKTGTPEFNKDLDRTQFADFHGHGWMYRAVFKKNRRGDLLDANDKIVSSITPEKLAASVAFQDKESATTTDTPDGAPVHLKDIHLEKGMHCADCHFRQDTHGNGNLYNEPRAAIEINCIDCHGSIQQRATLVTSGPAAGDSLINGKATFADKGRNLLARGGNMTTELTTSFKRRSGGRLVNIPVFQRIASDQKRKDASGVEQDLKAGDIIQNSMVEAGKWWRVVQTQDTVTPGTRDYNEESRYAKTIRTDGETWGDVPAEDTELAHRDGNMTCYTCHSAWVTSCFGCHLSMKANAKMPNRHNEGSDSRNYTAYNFQVLRDDIFMLGRDGTTTGRRIAPVRSSSAVLVSSQNQNREWIYSQQQTISAEGFAGQAFNTHVPHTVRSKETKNCSDCHIAPEKNNNAWMAQLFLQGTNFVNFIGQYAYVAAEDALEVVRVTEAAEPQAVIGSTLHKLAFPRNYANFERENRELKTFFEHKGNPEVLGVQVRGEYAYVAAGSGGLRVYDVAQIDHKGFSERIVTAPVSRFGQRFYVDTKHCTSVAAPSTLAVDPVRWRLTTDGRNVSPDEAAKLYAEWQQKHAAWEASADKGKTPEPVNPMLNDEQPIHPLYAYLYVVDREEGLILVNAATLLDGDPLNNFLSRALTFNPENKLSGANNITIAGTFAYVTTDNGLKIIDINNPLEPKIIGEINAPQLNKPRSIAIQFRYAFITDEEGLKVADVTNPRSAKLIENARVNLADAHDVYVARTYAYVANGKEGVAIVDVEQPEQPKLAQMFNAGGALNDAHQVKVAMTNASLYAYVADGHNGLRVLQLTDPETMPTFAGFSPRPEPRLIATFKTKGAALAVSKGLDRDRAVDESGNQVAVFGRRGASPLSLFDMQRMYLRNGEVFTVSDEPRTAPRDPKTPTAQPATNTKRHENKVDANRDVSHIAPVGTSYAVTTRTLAATTTITGFGLFTVILCLKRRRRK